MVCLFSSYFLCWSALGNGLFIAKYVVVLVIGIIGIIGQ